MLPIRFITHHRKINTLDTLSELIKWVDIFNHLALVSFIRHTLWLLLQTKIYFLHLLNK